MIQELCTTGCNGAEQPEYTLESMLQAIHKVRTFAKKFCVSIDACPSVVAALEAACDWSPNMPVYLPHTHLHDIMIRPSLEVPVGAWKETFADGSTAMHYRDGRVIHCPAVSTGNSR